MPSPRHVLITGAAGAIGAAIARSMRTAWPEARFALLDREPTAMEALAAEVGHATTHVVDLREIDALPAIVADLERVGGQLDGLVNCAGIMRVRGLTTLSWDEARDLMAVDLLAPLRLQDLVVRGLLERGAPGMIVNVSSMAGKVPLKGCAYYGASKAGLAMASEIARSELAAHHVRVVTVYPGLIKSSLEQGARDDWGGGGVLGLVAPTGLAAALSRRIVDAVLHDEPRVIYPRIYALGWNAPNLARWFALSYGPPPTH